MSCYENKVLLVAIIGLEISTYNIGYHGDKNPGTGTDQTTVS